MSSTFQAIMETHAIHPANMVIIVRLDLASQAEYHKRLRSMPGLDSPTTALAAIIERRCVFGIPDAL